MGCGQSRKYTKIKEQNITVPQVSAEENLRIGANLFIGSRKGYIQHKYSIGPRLGSGNLGYVRIATHIATGQKRAIKTIKKEKITKDMKERAKFYNEIDVLSSFDHPNIMRLYEFYEDDKNYHLITEYIPGGELFDYVIKSKNLTEHIAAKFMKQILSGVAYCHTQNIVHRSLLPENLLLDKASEDANLKIIDFGTSRIVLPDSKLSQKFGASFYTAPEVIKKVYNEKCDVWSCGIILYLFLSGKLPFTGRNEAEIFQRVLEGTFYLKGSEWEAVSDSAKDLVKSMLKTDPSLRISAKEALSHQWIVENASQYSSEVPLKTEALQNLQNFHTEKKLQQAVLTFISSQLISKEEYKKLTENFKVLDKNGDGKISKEELLEGLKNTSEIDNAEEEVEKIMKEVDTNGSGYIDYTEFLMATSQKQALLSKNNLDSAFQAFDIDNSGKISANELKQILGAGAGLSDRLWQELISEVDQNNDGEIDYSEFKNMMMKLIESNLNQKI